MTGVDVARLRALAEAATPGPWAVPAANVFRVIAPEAPHTNPPQGMTPPYPWRVVAEMGEPDGTAADAAYLAAVSPDVLVALLDENRRLREALAGVLAAADNVNRHVGLLAGERNAFEAARAVLAEGDGDGA